MMGDRNTWTNGSPIRVSNSFNSTFNKPFSISGWVSTVVPDNQSYMIFGANDSDGGSLPDVRFDCHSSISGDIRVIYTTDNDSATWICSTDERPFDAFLSPLVHLVITVDHTSINGVLADDNGSAVGDMTVVTMSEWSIDNENFLLGAWYYKGYNYYGYPLEEGSILADWRIYNYVLDADEADALYINDGVGYHRETVAVVNDADDAMFHKDTSGAWLTGQPQTLYLGQDRDLTFYFRNIGIPAGATVLSAAFSGKSNWTEYTDTIHLEIDVADTANASVPTDFNSFDNINFTGNPVHWDIDGYVRWNSGEEIYTPDIGSLIQTIVDKDGWADGNNILVTIYDDLTSTSYRAFRSYAGTPDTLWTEYLFINWKKNL